VRSIVNLIQRPGLIRIGFDDLLVALRSDNGRCLFGYGESDSDNRAHDALTQALKNPLMDKGKMLADAGHVLVQVAGGPAMTLSEVEILMQELGKHVRDNTQILFGTAVDGRMGNRLSVTIISSLVAEDETVPQQEASFAQPEPLPTAPPSSVPIWEQSEPAPKIDIVPEPVIAEANPPPEDLIAYPAPAPVEVPVEPKPVVKKQPPVPRLIVPKKKPLPVKEPKPVAEKHVPAKQEVLQFEPVTRGRFEKSEPTIIEGQDLDVPTFLRKNIRVK
jgi:cell division protein FtsZ